MSDEQMIHTIRDWRTEAEDALEGWRGQAKEDFQMAMGDQWEAAVLAELQSKNAPALVINLIQKHLNVVSGMERQSGGDLVALPIESGDELGAEVYSMLMKWILQERGARFIKSDAFKDSLICGLGWIYTYIHFNDDPFNGDVGLRKPSPFNMLWDPHLCERDLSDCRYLFHRKKLWNKDCARLYPQYRRELEDMTAGQPRDQYDLNTRSPRDKNEYIEVLECWHREFEKVTYVIDPRKKEDMQRWTGKKKDLKEFLKATGFIALEREVSAMRLSTLVEDSLLVYDGPSPYEGNDFPFTPIWGFFFSSYDDWKWKCQGIVRGLKDIQREKNKRRSVIMQTFGMMPHSYWKYEKGAVDDEASLDKSAGIGKKIKVNPGKIDAVKAETGPEIPMSAITLEQMSDNDFTATGQNPDLLGQMMERGAPIGAIKIRQQQGVTAIQEIYDSDQYSSVSIGRKIMYLIANNWSVDKIKRIVGDDFYYTKIIKDLQNQLQQIMSQRPQPMELPPEYSQAQEIAHGMATEGGKAVIEGDIMMNKNAQEQQMIQMQMEQIQNQAYAVAMQLKDAIQKEKDFWNDFERSKREARYDFKVEESTSSPTYRYQVFEELKEAAKYGLVGPVPLEVMFEFLPNLPRAVKERWLSLNAMQQQMAMQAQGGRGGAQG